MDIKQINELMMQEKYQELVEQLELQIEEYDEYAMLMLCRGYLFLGDEKKAKKMLRRVKMLYPAGEYMQEEDQMLNAINDGSVEKFINNLKMGSVAQKEKVSIVKQSSLMTALELGKKKKEKVILETIREYFANVIGMESIQADLDKFYKMLRFQNERHQKEFQTNLLKSTHFIISGERGCGKTMVAEIIAKLLSDFNIRKEEQPLMIEACELRYAFDNNRADGIKKLFEKGNNATVVVENIQYILNEDSQQDDRDRELIDALEKVMREKKDVLSIILTASPSAKRKLLAVNATMQDSVQAIIEIPEYATVELFSIIKKLAQKKALLIHENAEKVLMRKIDVERNLPDFMNAITLNRIIEEAAGKMAERYFENSDSSESAMVYLRAEDFEVEMETENLEELIAELDALIGLKSVKNEIKKRIEAITVQQHAQQAGSERADGTGTLHMLFMGNPGTGKTTVARMLGKIYQQLGVLPRGNQIVECTRANLVGMYQGHTANLVRQKAKEAMGGVLFIDEAYALCRDKNDSFGHEAVDELMTVLENNRDNMMVIFAGYQKEMEAFLKSNSGFNSRIRKQIMFEDYTVDEMEEIFLHMVSKANMQMEPEVKNLLKDMLATKSRVPDFGNARGVRNLFDEVIEAMNERVSSLKSLGIELGKSAYDTITDADIKAVAGKKMDGEKSLDELMAELRELTGLAGVKSKVQEMVDEIQVKEYMKSQGMKTEDGHGTLHLVFKGNAGTGKTTVARLIGKIYKKLGVLKKDIFVEVSRKDLVAEYLGKTAKLVNEKIDEADGGILFIDEAYMLSNGERDQFGQEAIGTLVTELENRRDSLMVIMAGYSDKMKEFLNANQGLASRLSNEIIFEDYTDEELEQIFEYMVLKKELLLDTGVNEDIRRVIGEYRRNTKDFGNARGVRNIFEKVLRKKNSRIAALIRNGVSLKPEDIAILKKEDFDI